MPGPRYTLITGSYYIQYPDLPNNGPQPDGDTINFLPDQDDLVTNLPRFNGVAPDRKHLGSYGVRFEGVDALETHFLSRHQNLGFANEARDEMLALVGFTNVAFSPNHPNEVATVDNNPLRGHLLANGIESNGRVLALVFPGDPPTDLVDGDKVHATTATLDQSVNAALIRDGLAYAELYSTMPLELITHLRQLITSARARGRGIFPHEDVTVGHAVQLQGLADLPNLVSFPKLYRRLVRYFLDGNVGLDNFDTWVRADPTHRDDRALLPTGEMGNMHDLFSMGPNGIELQFLPEALMWETDPI
ncbi:MAG TPA: hypothetical protein VH682_04335 [Gemmataceae bacterium]